MSEAAAPKKAARRQTGEVRRLRRRRLRRCRRWNAFFNSNELCIAGLLMALIFLFNPSPLFRIPQFVFFCFLAWLSGKKYNPLITALIMAGIVFFNLLVPYGKVLAALGPLRITQGSLLAGFGKALTLEGLVMLSASCVKPDLRLPGSLGALLGESFRLLGLLRERRAIIRRGHVIEGIDQLMRELEAAPAGTRPGRNAPPAASGLSRLLLAGMVMLTAAMGIVQGV